MRLMIVKRALHMYVHVHDIVCVVNAHCPLSYTFSIKSMTSSIHLKVVPQ